MARVLRQELSEKLAEEILYGALEEGGVAVVDAPDGADGKLAFSFEPLPVEGADAVGGEVVEVG